MYIYDGNTEINNNNNI